MTCGSRGYEAFRISYILVGDRAGLTRKMRRRFDLRSRPKRVCAVLSGLGFELENLFASTSQKCVEIPGGCAVPGGTGDPGSADSPIDNRDFIPHLLAQPRSWPGGAPAGHSRRKARTGKSHAVSGAISVQVDSLLDAWISELPRYEAQEFLSPVQDAVDDEMEDEEAKLPAPRPSPVAFLLWSFVYRKRKKCQKSITP